MAVNITEIEQAFANNRKAVDALKNAIQQENDARLVYEEARRDLILSGEITGKNETERTALLESKLQEQIFHLELCKAVTRAAKVDYEICQARIQMFQMEISFLQLQR